MATVSKAPGASPVNFRIVLLESWSRRAAQMGGSGFNGFIPNLLMGTDMFSWTPLTGLGFATYGSESGHQMGPMTGFPSGPAKKSLANSDDWAISDELMKNLGYMQLKKTHDAAMFHINKIYQDKPKYNYFFGTSQGGREAFTAAQRYPEDYDGVAADVSVVILINKSLSTKNMALTLKKLDQNPRMPALSHHYERQ